MPAQRQCDVCDAKFRRYIRSRHAPETMHLKLFGVLFESTKENTDPIWLCKRCYEQAALTAHSASLDAEYTIHDEIVVDLDKMVTTEQVARSMVALVRNERDRREKEYAARVTGPASLVSTQG